MTALTLPLAPNTRRKPRIDTARADHWAPRQPQAARRPVEDTMRIEHWAAHAKPAAQPLADPWQSLGRAYERVVAGERTPGQTLRARWSAWRERRAAARIDAEIRAMAAGDERLLRDIQVARDLAEWR